MRRRNFFIVKFIAVTLMLGFFSPTVTIEKIETDSASKMAASQSLLAKLSTSEITFSLFTQAEARKKKKYKKSRKRKIRRVNRRANYRHHHHHHHNRNNALGAFVAGAVVGAVINEASQEGR